ncbi:MAG: TetR/AcrR family transcriptional regulator [Acidimicrobiia bacterium]
MTTAGEWKARPAGPDYEATRQRLVDAAEAVVRERGVGALRLDSVAEAVGLHRSSIYRYFDSKEELITAVVVQASLRVGHRVMHRLGDHATPEQFLVEGLVIALGEMGDNPVFTSLLAPAASASMTRIAGAALTEGIRPLIEPMFVAAAQRGVLRDGVTPEDAIQWLQIVATGLLRLPGIPAPAELAALLQRMLLPALLDGDGAPHA